jgi:hypothetical protein
LTIAAGLTVAARPENLLAASAAKVHAILAARANAVVSEPLLDVAIAVFHSLAVFRSVLPIVSDIVDIHRPVYGDVVAPPIDPAAPIVPA